MEISYPCFLGKIPAFWRKKRGFCFFGPLKTAILVFVAVFLFFFFPLSTLFLANPFLLAKKMGKEDQGIFLCQIPQAETSEELRKALLERP